MGTERNAFNALCLLASREKWCWKLFCTTCGHGHFRCALFELAEGRHPEKDGWLTRQRPPASAHTLGDWQTITTAIQQSERLHRLLAGASLTDIAEHCGFPDYLGYLGLALNYTEQLEQRNRLLTPLWSTQLLDIVEKDSSAASMLRKRISLTDRWLTWRDLDGLENSVIPKYRLRRQ